MPLVLTYYAIHIFKQTCRNLFFVSWPFSPFCIIRVNWSNCYMIFACMIFAWWKSTWISCGYMQISQHDICKDTDANMWTCKYNSMKFACILLACHFYKSKVALQELIISLENGKLVIDLALTCSQIWHSIHSVPYLWLISV